MPDQSPAKLVGCLVDVSASMKEALESGRSEEGAGDRLRAVLRATLKVAQAEQRHNTNAFVFVGAFGLNVENCPDVVDLCGVIDALLVGHNSNKTGRELLIELAKGKDLGYIAKFIKDKFSDDEARIIHAFLQRHPHRVDEFVKAIPSEGKIHFLHTGSRVMEGTTGSLPLGLPFLTEYATVLAKSFEDGVVDRSEGMKLAHSMREEWWKEFSHFVPRPVDNVVHLLQRLEEHSKDNGNGDGGNTGKVEKSRDRNLLDTLRPYMYGGTPMRETLKKSLLVFRKHANAKQQVLVLVSDGMSTDGDPLPIARELKKTVSLATVYLTGDQETPRRRLYDRKVKGWNIGQGNLFSMASAVSTDEHPIPVFTSMGWEISSSGECALYTIVSSAALLDEFCSMLLSARFGSADVLLDIVGRVDMDKIVNTAHGDTCKHGTTQKGLPTCYAHATATALHMSLVRIVGREGGYPSFDNILKDIKDRFPPGPNGRAVAEVLKEAITWYRPLRFQKVDEDGARQAVLRRRPVLATFRLSHTGWATFYRHFGSEATCKTVLERDQMAQHRSPPDSGGHAVVLTKCAPGSLTFLNSWGRSWAEGGSFSVQDHTVLELDGASGTGANMCFYDIYWYESDLTAGERQAYNAKVDKALRDRLDNHRSSILELEVRCPRCCKMAPIAQYTGSIRKAVCPFKQCGRSFVPEPEHLIKALYSRAGLCDV